MGRYSETPTKTVISLANNGDRDACLELSERYSTGTVMLKRDMGKADYWRKRANGEVVSSFDNISGFKDDRVEQSVPQINKIDSLEKMDSFLSSLQMTASHSVAEALKAQLAVIRFVSSPSLIDTTLDTLILNLKKSLDSANSEDERNRLRELFSLMIQNYIFFFDARLQYAINDNKKQGRALLEEAGKQLTETATQVALMAATGGVSAIGIAQVTIENFFVETEEKKSIFQKVIGWFSRSSEIASKKQEFYQTLYKMIQKLNKYREWIGASMLIEGVIERYAEDIADYTYDTQIYDNERAYEASCNELERTNLFTYKGEWATWTFGLGVVTILFRWIWYLLSSGWSTALSWFMDDVIVTDHSGWFLPHFGFVLGAAVFVEIIAIIYTWPIRNNIQQRIADLLNEKKSLMDAKNQLVNEIKTIADKYSEL